jgi:hypothetical protein
MLHVIEKQRLLKLGSLAGMMVGVFTLLYVARAQSPSQTQDERAAFAAEHQPGPNVKLSREDLYLVFFDMQRRLDTDAALREKQGRDGSWLRNHFQEKFNFSDAEMRAVRLADARLDIEMAQIRAQALAFSKAYRAKLPYTVSKSSTPPPMPAEIIELSKQRDALIDAEIASVQKSLIPDHAAELEKFVTVDLVKKSVTLHSNTHEPLDSAHRLLSPEARP